jgi:lactate dehydrogenase-like 2-hydroxyacid dehydrogenase
MLEELPSHLLAFSEALSPGLAELENVVLAPHIGSATFEARDAMGRLCVDAVIAVLRGEEPEHVLV